jgi:serine/threonine-protein kinase
LGVGNKVAIKVLDPAPGGDPVRIPRFIQEAKVGLTVVHPGAAQLLDMGTDDVRGFLYLVFEYVEGEDLRALLKRENKLSFDEARSIVLRAAEALAFAHAHGVVHRDIKPENIRVRRDLAGLHVKVLDFGIARLVKEGSVRLTGDGLLAGTPRYMAPEQVRDAPIDARTDIYALGLTLFEMLSGRPAFDGINPALVMKRQVEEAVPALGNPAVDAFLSMACAKRPDGRFPSMEALVLALKDLDPERKSIPPAEKKRWFYVVLAALGALAVTAWWLHFLP